MSKETKVLESIFQEYINDKEKVIKLEKKNRETTFDFITTVVNKVEDKIKTKDLPCDLIVENNQTWLTLVRDLSESKDTSSDSGASFCLASKPYCFEIFVKISTFQNISRSKTIDYLGDIFRDERLEKIEFGEGINLFYNVKPSTIIEDYTDIVQSLIVAMSKYYSDQEKKA